MDRWCLCGNCVAAIRSRGEKVMARPMEWDDCTEEELETDLVLCEWCEEEYDRSEIYVCD